MPRESVTFNDVECLKETPKALLVNIDGDEFWIPKSVVDDDSEVYHEGHRGKLVLHEWFCEKEGLI